MTQRKRRDNIFAFYPELGKNAVGNPVKALEILPKALNAFRKAGRYDMQAETYYYMAESYFLTGNAPQVVSNATQAISLISQHNVKQEFLPRCYNMMGIGYSSAGEYNMSQQYYLEAMKYAKLFKDDRTALSIRNNIGSLFLQMGDYEEAAVYMNSVYELASMRLADPEYGMLTSDEQKNRRETFYVTMLNMADISYHEGNYDVALRYLKQLESALKGEAFFRYINSIYTIRVKIYLSMDDMVNVKKAVKDLLEKAESDDAGNCTEIFDDCFEIGKMLLEKDEKEMTWGVLQILRRVCELLEKVNRWTVYYGLLAQYYAEWGEEKDYLYACAQYHNYGIENAIETTKSMLEGIKNRMEIEKNMALQKAQQEQAEEMRLLSETDELTSLLNRRSFNRLSQKYFDTAEDEAAKFGLVMMDIDYFKQYNDEYGHVAGDGCLKGIAQVLKDNESEGFLASRYGGDEFIIICRDRSDDEIVAYMNKILADVNKLALPHIKSPITDHVTVTLGGVNGTPKAEKHTVMDIVQMADDALYEAKAQGKNRAYFEV